MIRSIHLKNFKAHADSKVEFGPVTTFIGESDEGKSTIALKALRIALTGQNWDPGWLRHGTSKGSITAVLDNGAIIERGRTTDGQTVKTVDKDGHETKYTKIKGAEEFILQLSGLRKVVLDAQEGPQDLNIIRNRQPLFLIENDPEVVQRKVVGILQCNEIESAKIRLTKKLNQKKADQAYLKEENQNLVARLEALVPVRTEVHQVDDALDDAVERHQKTRDCIQLLRDQKEQTHVLIITESRVEVLKQLYNLVLRSCTVAQNRRVLQESGLQAARVEALTRMFGCLEGLTAVIRHVEAVEHRKELQSLVAELQSAVDQETIGECEALLNQEVCPVCGTKLSAI